jgi:copper chaperone CopZ
MIPNMHCAHCLESIKDAAFKLAGVVDVSGDPARQIVTVIYREGIADPDGIRTAIIERGFRVADATPASTPVAAPDPRGGAGR